jgi:hypothetical protein
VVTRQQSALTTQRLIHANVGCNAKKKLTMNRIALILALMTLTLLPSNAQQLIENINHLVFRFSHSKRIPNHYVEIELIKRESITRVHVNSTPMDNDRNWINTKVDTTYFVENSVFERLAIQAVTLTNIDLYRAFNLEAGLDGTTATIMFGKYGATVSYRFWNPDHLTEYRGLSDFYDLCKNIVLIGGLKPEEIF